MKNYNIYKITYAWTWGDLTEHVAAFDETEARNTFLNYMYSAYGETVMAAAAFKILSIEKEA